MKRDTKVLMYKVVNRFGKTVRKMVPSDVKNLEVAVSKMSLYGKNHLNELPPSLIVIERTEREVRTLVDFI